MILGIPRLITVGKRSGGYLPSDNSPCKADESVDNNSLFPFSRLHELRKHASSPTELIECAFLHDPTISEADNPVASPHRLRRMGNEDRCPALTCHRLCRPSPAYVFDLDDSVQDSALVLHIQCTRALIQDHHVTSPT